MSERVHHSSGPAAMENIQLGDFVQNALAFLGALWPVKSEDDTEIDWEDGEPDGDRDR